MISYSRHASPPYGPKLLVQPTTLSIGRDFLCLVGGGLRGTEIRWLPAMHSKKKEGCWSLQDVALLCLCSEFRVVSKIVVHFVPRPAGRVALFSTNQTVWLPPCRPLMYMLPLLLSFLMIVSPPALWFSTQHSYDRILRCRTTSTVWVSHCVMRLIWHVALNFGCTAAASSRRTPSPGGPSADHQRLLLGCHHPYNMPPFIVDTAGMYRYYIVDQLSVDGICVPVLRKSGLSLKKNLTPFFESTITISQLHIYQFNHCTGWCDNFHSTELNDDKTEQNRKLNRRSCLASTFRLEQHAC